MEVTTSIKAQEDRHTLGPPDQWNPRAGIPDDVESFFAICPRYLGATFILRDFVNRLPKTVKYTYNLFCIQDF